MAELTDGKFDAEKMKCCDCGGWPIDDGAVFVAVFLIRKGVPTLGGMCELCWLKRLSRRVQMVNMTSSPMYQIDLPELGLRKREER